MEDMIVKGRLLDCYGQLLTDRQRDCMEQYYEQDRSLAEIAENLGVSRQAVHDNLHRATTLLEEYEKKLQLLAAEEKRREILTNLKVALADEKTSRKKLLSLLAQLD